MYFKWGTFLWKSGIWSQQFFLEPLYCILLEDASYYYVFRYLIAGAGIVLCSTEYSH
jgi:hypothetical protein